MTDMPLLAKRLVSDLKPASVVTAGAGAVALAEAVTAVGTKAEPLSAATAQGTDLALLRAHPEVLANPAARASLDRLAGLCSRLIYWPDLDEDEVLTAELLTPWIEALAQSGYQPAIGFDASFVTKGAFLADRKSKVTEAALKTWLARLVPAAPAAAAPAAPAPAATAPAAPAPAAASAAPASAAPAAPATPAAAAKPAAATSAAPAPAASPAASAKPAAPAGKGPAPAAAPTAGNAPTGAAPALVPAESIPADVGALRAALSVRDIALSARNEEVISLRAKLTELEAEIARERATRAEEQAVLARMAEWIRTVCLAPARFAGPQMGMFPTPEQKEQAKAVANVRKRTDYDPVAIILANPQISQSGEDPARFVARGQAAAAPKPAGDLRSA